MLMTGGGNSNNLLLKGMVRRILIPTVQTGAKDIPAGGNWEYACNGGYTDLRKPGGACCMGRVTAGYMPAG
jgi:hypothetical protein